MFHTFNSASGVTHVEITCVLRLKGNDRLAADLYLRAVLRPEPRHDFDAVRHDRWTCAIPGRPCVQERAL
jgi:hypothetical protein